MRVSFKLNKNGLGPSYGTSFDIYRLFIFGFPRELRNLLMKEEVYKLDTFESIQFKLDADVNGQVIKMVTDVAEGSGTNSNTGLTVYDKGTIHSLDTRKNGLTVFGDYQRGMIPSHIPKQQTYMWVVKHFSIEENFKHYVEKICIDEIECCDTRLKSLGIKKVNFCPSCGGSVLKLINSVAMSNYRLTTSTAKTRHTSETLKIEDVPYEYVMTRRQRTSKVPII